MVRIWNKWVNQWNIETILGFEKSKKIKCPLGFGVVKGTEFTDFRTKEISTYHTFKKGTIVSIKQKQDEPECYICTDVNGIQQEILKKDLVLIGC